MRIESSSIQMAGSSSYAERNTKEESLKMWTGSARPDFEGNNSVFPLVPSGYVQSGDSLKLSAEGKEALEKQMSAASSCSICDDDELSDLISDGDKQKILMLQKMIEALTGKKFKLVLPDKNTLNKIRSSEKIIHLNRGSVAAQVNRPQGWGLEYDMHATHYEKQAMTFSAKGTVKTADGKEISLDLELNMSREFASSIDVSVRAGDAVKVDPLVVNFAGSSAALTNSKFSFDIDADGNDDQISFATGGSGFLAFDVNKDGFINNGAELFGPQSGNGFNDLARYDGDGNGWIDENDDIYDKLRIWTKDESGNDQLFALGAKGIGAIYLGNAATAFDVKAGGNNTLGSIARSGIYLKENGTAGTIQHVDLVL